MAGEITTVVTLRMQGLCVRVSLYDYMSHTNLRLSLSLSLSPSLSPLPSSLPPSLSLSPGELLPIRLRDGDNELEGRVEVYYNGTWGTVCDDYWDLRDATVACHQLGFVQAVRAHSFSHFGAGEGDLLTNEPCHVTIT